MLRLISISGIALAMVIGFVALSTQMRDDYYMRAKVSDAVKYLYSVAQQELDCGVAGIKQNATDARPAKPAIWSTVTHEITTHEAQVTGETTDKSAIEVAGVFHDVKGESGKLRIKQGRKFILNCVCHNDALQCQQGLTDINKNYIPPISTAK
ncbi:MAG TPA: hypothetical protein VIM41_07630 [Gammaproteobacteria bacterium]